ncbi:MAG: hypothetical protein CW716_06945 [Candidatus Bathyarchaeum sp.]|nr:MAG: hypothetical protein CW716_06945 [Candidatus Bathyarchaeum sp.]
MVIMGHAMKNSLLSVFLTVMLLSGFALCGVASFVCAQNSTYLSGIISSDTTWTKTNSPYTLTGNVLIANDVTLTIEPGTSVNFEKYYIQVLGTLYARGNNEAAIHFIGSGYSSFDSTEKIFFENPSTDWNEESSSGCIIENAQITGLSIRVNDASPKINNNQFGQPSGNDVISITSANSTPIITNNCFEFTESGVGYGINVNGGNPKISGNTLTGNGFNTGIVSTGLIRLFNNTISGCWTGISGNSMIIEGNVILNNSRGISVGSNSIIQNNLISGNQYGINEGLTIIQNNTITYNLVGIQKPDPSSTIMYNNVHDNTEYNLYVASNENIDVSYNWWGTTDVQEINQSIYDYK